MAERFPTKTPVTIQGSPVESGTPNTGQIQYTLGGQKTYTKLSGVIGPDVLIVAGGGRLDAGFLHDTAMLALSGLAVTFYDAAVAVSGGPLSTSGHKVVGVLNYPSNTGLSGGLLKGGRVESIGFVFTSGLCHTTASGQPGFSVSFTPVTSS